MQTMLSYHPLSDYVAVSISRRIKPEGLIADGREIVQDGGLELIINLCEASKATFETELSFGHDFDQFLPRALELFGDKQSPLRTRAIIRLSVHKLRSENAAAHNGDRSEDLDLINLFPDHAKPKMLQLKQELRRIISDLSSKEDSRSRNELRHALILAGELRDFDSLPVVAPLLKLDHPLVHEVITALGCFGNQDSAKQLIGLVESTVNLEDRTNRVLSKHPVQEADGEKVKANWLALGAIGKLPHPESIQLLCRTCQDILTGSA